MRDRPLIISWKNSKNSGTRWAGLRPVQGGGAALLPAPRALPEELAGFGELRL